MVIYLYMASGTRRKANDDSQSSSEGSSSTTPQFIPQVPFDFNLGSINEEVDDSNGLTGIASVPKDILTPLRDHYSLAEVARRHGISADRPTEIEAAFFPEVQMSRSFSDVFLMIRNTTLSIWLASATTECTAEDVIKHLTPPYNTEIHLVQNIVLFLSRFGMINIGFFFPKTELVNNMEKKFVVVIGAGAAGIAAATQLLTFGFDVAVVEASGLTGGRVRSLISKHGELIETGCDSLRNLDESVITTLLHQVPLNENIMSENTIVFSKGKYVPVARCHVINGLYANLKAGLAHASHGPEQRGENGLYISRQQAYENYFNMIERSTLLSYYNFAKEKVNLNAERKHLYEVLKTNRLTALLAEQKLKNTPPSDELLLKSLQIDIEKAIRQFDEACERFEICEERIADLEKNPRCKQSMHPNDFIHYNFLLGFEERLFGAQLEKVQFSCNVNELKLKSQVARVQEGLAQVLINVANERKVKIHHNQRVIEIDTGSSDAVILKLRKPDGSVGILNADYVVSTLPIGVLKKTIIGDERAPVFRPPLPKSKFAAIRSLGNGLINKIVFVFETRFWPESINQFAIVPDKISERAAMFTWSSLPESRTLTTHYVGENRFHDTPVTELITKALEMLKTVFKDCPSPIDAYVTNWHTDELAFGTGTFMSLRTEPQHFDALKEPLKTRDGKPRVFFAGEHTSALEHGTLDGAFNSGLRAAADLANTCIEIPFINRSRDLIFPPYPRARYSNEGD